MDCDSPTRSADALARLIARYDAATGCAVMQVEEASLGDAVDCTRHTSLTLLLLALNESGRTVRVNITEIVESDLCATYTPRVTCDRMASLAELLAEVATLGTAPVCIVLEGAGDAGLNGTYCPDGTHLTYPRWTKVGGVTMEDSIHVIQPGGPITYWVVTSGGTYAADPANAKAYSDFSTFTEPVPPLNTWFTSAGGTEPAPTWGASAAAGTEVVLRVAKLTDMQPRCEDCFDRLTSAMEAMVASFVTDGTDTYVLIGEPDGGTYEYLDCDTAGLTATQLVRGALARAGGCGMMAWKTEVI